MISQMFAYGSHVLIALQSLMDFDGHLCDLFEALRGTIIENRVFRSFTVHFQEVTSIDVLLLKYLRQCNTGDLYSIRFFLRVPKDSGVRRKTIIDIKDHGDLSRVAEDRFGKDSDITSFIQISVFF